MALFTCFKQVSSRTNEDPHYGFHSEMAIEMLLIGLSVAEPVYSAPTRSFIEIRQVLTDSVMKKPYAGTLLGKFKLPYLYPAGSIHWIQFFSIQLFRKFGYTNSSAAESLSVCNLISRPNQPAKSAYHTIGCGLIDNTVHRHSDVQVRWHSNLLRGTLASCNQFFCTNLAENLNNQHYYAKIGKLEYSIFLSA